MSVNRSGYYKWKQRQKNPSERQLRRESDLRLIKEVHDHITAVLDSTDDLKGLEWHQVAPMGGNDPYKDENGVLTDSNDYAYRYTDIMIPQSYAFTKYYSNAERIEAKKLGIVLFPL